MLTASDSPRASSRDEKTRTLIFLGDFLGLGCRDVEDAGKFDFAQGGEFGVNAGVFLAEGADSEDGDFEL